MATLTRVATAAASIAALAVVALVLLVVIGGRHNGDAGNNVSHALEASPAVIPAPSPRVADCSPVREGSIAESLEFTPYEARLSTLPDGLVPRSRGVPDAAVIRDDTVGGLRRQADVLTDVGAVYTYFADELSDDMTVTDFVAAGGIQLIQEPSRTEVLEGATVTFAERLAEQLGARAVRIQVGLFPGALTWADPDQRGTRPHYLHWSTLQHDFVLIADMSAAEIVTLARQLACDG